MPPKRKRGSAGESKNDTEQTTEDFLDSLNYSQYSPVLVDDGYETFQELQHVTLDDMIGLGVKKGHARRILASIQEKVSTITIIITDDGRDSFFKVKRTTSMQKVFSAYAQKNGVSITGLQFFRYESDFDWYGLIDATDTPQSLELENDEKILAKRGLHAPDDINVIIRLKDQGGDETFFKVKKSTMMQQIFKAYATRKGVNRRSLKFLIDGTRIDGAETPQSLGLEDQDQVDCILQMIGDIGVFGTHSKAVGIELLKANTEAHLNLSPRQNEVKVKAICSSLPNAKPNSLFHSYDTEEYLSKAQRETIITNIDAAWETFKNEGLTNNNNDLYFVRQDSTISDFKIILAKRQLEKMTKSSETVNNLYSLLYRHKDGEAAKEQNNTAISLVVRRCTQIGHAIKFHTDVSIRTLQVPLNDTFVGGDLVFATNGKICVPQRPAGSATVHGNDIAHGVTTLRSGIRYSLFLLLQQNKTSC